MLEKFGKIFGIQRKPSNKEDQLPYEQQQQEVLRQKPLEGVDDLLESADSVLGDIDTVLKENEVDLLKREVSDDDDELEQKESAEKRGFFGAIGRKSKEAGKWISETAREGVEGAKKIAGALRQNPELRKEIAKKLEVGAERWLSVKGGGDILKAFTGKGDLASLVKGVFEKSGEIKKAQEKVELYGTFIKDHRNEFVDVIQDNRLKRVLELLGKNEEEIAEASRFPEEEELRILRAELQETSPTFLEGKTWDQIQEFLVKHWKQNRYLRYKQELEARGTYIVWARSEDIEKKPDKLQETKARIESKHHSDAEKAGVPLKVLILEDGRSDVFRQGLEQGIKDIHLATSEGRAKKGEEGFSEHTRINRDQREIVRRELATIAAHSKNREDETGRVMKAHVEGVVNIWDEFRDVAATVATGFGRVELRAATGMLSRIGKGAHEAAKMQKRDEVTLGFEREKSRLLAHEERYGARILQIQQFRARILSGATFENQEFLNEMMEFNRKYRSEAEISLDDAEKPPFEEDKFVEFFKTSGDIEKYLKQADSQYANSLDKLERAHKGILESGDEEHPEHGYLWYLKETVANKARDTVNNFKIWRNKSTLTQEQGVVRNIISAGQGFGDIFRFMRFGRDAEELTADIIHGDVFGKEGNFVEYLQEGGQKLASRFYEDDLAYTLIDRHLHRDDLSEERKEILASLQEKLSHGGKMTGAEQTMLQKIEEQARDMRHKEISGEKLSDFARGTIGVAKQAAAEEYGAASILEKIGRNLGEYNVKRSLSTLTELPDRFKRIVNIAERGTGAVIANLDRTGANIARRAYGDDLTALVFQKESVSGTREMPEGTRERLFQYFTGGVKRDELTSEDEKPLQEIERETYELFQKHKSGAELTDDETALIAAAEQKALIDYLDDGVLEKIAMNADAIRADIAKIGDVWLRDYLDAQVALIEQDPKQYAEGLRMCGVGMMTAININLLPSHLRPKSRKGLYVKGGVALAGLAVLAVLGREWGDEAVEFFKEGDKERKIKNLYADFLSEIKTEGDRGEVLKKIKTEDESTIVNIAPITPITPKTADGYYKPPAIKIFVPEPLKTHQYESEYGYLTCIVSSKDDEPELLVSRSIEYPLDNKSKLGNVQVKDGDITIAKRASELGVIVLENNYTRFNTDTRKYEFKPWSTIRFGTESVSLPFTEDKIDFKTGATGPHPFLVHSGCNTTFINIVHQDKTETRVAFPKDKGKNIWVNRVDAHGKKMEFKISALSDLPEFFDKDGNYIGPFEAPPLEQYLTGGFDNQRQIWKNWLVNVVTSRLNRGVLVGEEVGLNAERFLSKNRDIIMSAYCDKSFLPWKSDEHQKLTDLRHKWESEYFDPVADPDRLKETEWMFADGKGVLNQELFQESTDHDAYDIFMSEGTPIKAYTGGFVVAVGSGWEQNASGEWKTGTGLSPRAGNGALIYNPILKSYSYYTYLKDVSVSVGDRIEAGDLIGTVGKTGILAAQEEPHLHFEYKMENQDGALVAQHITKEGTQAVAEPTKVVEKPKVEPPKLPIPKTLDKKPASAGEINDLSTAFFVYGDRTDDLLANLRERYFGKDVRLPGHVWTFFSDKLETILSEDKKNDPSDNAATIAQLKKVIDFMPIYHRAVVKSGKTNEVIDADWKDIPADKKTWVAFEQYVKNGLKFPEAVSATSAAVSAAKGEPVSLADALIIYSHVEGAIQGEIEAQIARCFFDRTAERINYLDLDFPDSVRDIIVSAAKEKADAITDKNTEGKFIDESDAKDRAELEKITNLIPRLQNLYKTPLTLAVAKSELEKIGTIEELEEHIAKAEAEAEELKPKLSEPLTEAQTVSKLLNILYQSNTGLPQELRNGIDTEDELDALKSALSSFNIVASEHFSTPEISKIWTEMPDKSAAGLKSSAQHIEAIAAFFNNPNEPLLKIVEEGRGYKNPYTIDINEGERAAESVEFFERLKQVKDDYSNGGKKFATDKNHTKTIDGYFGKLYETKHSQSYRDLGAMQENIKTAVSMYVDKKIEAIPVPTISETVTEDEKARYQKDIADALAQIDENKKLLARVWVDAPQKVEIEKRERELQSAQEKLTAMTTTVPPEAPKLLTEDDFIKNTQAAQDTVKELHREMFANKNLLTTLNRVPHDALDSLVYNFSSSSLGENLSPGYIKILDEAIQRVALSDSEKKDIEDALSPWIRKSIGNEVSERYSIDGVGIDRAKYLNSELEEWNTYWKKYESDITAVLDARIAELRDDWYPSLGSAREAGVLTTVEGKENVLLWPIRAKGSEIDGARTLGELCEKFVKTKDEDIKENIRATIRGAFDAETEGDMTLIRQAIAERFGSQIRIANDGTGTVVIFVETEAPPEEAQNTQSILDNLPSKFTEGLDEAKIQMLKSAVENFYKATQEHFSPEERNKILTDMPDKSAAGLKSSAQHIEAITAFFNNPNEPIKLIIETNSKYDGTFAINTHEEAGNAVKYYSMLKSAEINYLKRYQELERISTETVQAYLETIYDKKHRSVIARMFDRDENIQGTVTAYVMKEVNAITVPSIGTTVTPAEKVRYQEKIAAGLARIDENKKLLEKVDLDVPQELTSKETQLNQAKATLEGPTATPPPPEKYPTQEAPFTMQTFEAGKRDEYKAVVRFVLKQEDVENEKKKLETFLKAQHIDAEVIVEDKEENGAVWHRISVGGFKNYGDIQRFADEVGTIENGLRPAIIQPEIVDWLHNRLSPMEIFTEASSPDNVWRGERIFFYLKVPFMEKWELAILDSEKNTRYTHSEKGRQKSEPILFILYPKYTQGQSDPLPDGEYTLQLSYKNKIQEQRTITIDAEKPFVESAPSKEHFTVESLLKHGPVALSRSVEESSRNKENKEREDALMNNTSYRSVSSISSRQEFMEEMNLSLSKEKRENKEREVALHKFLSQIRVSLYKQRCDLMTSLKLVESKKGDASVFSKKWLEFFSQSATTQDTIQDSSNIDIARFRMIIQQREDREKFFHALALEIYTASLKGKDAFRFGSYREALLATRYITDHFAFMTEEYFEKNVKGKEIDSYLADLILEVDEKAIFQQPLGERWIPKRVGESVSQVLVRERYVFNDSDHKNYKNKVLQFNTNGGDNPATWKQLQELGLDISKLNLAENEKNLIASIDPARVSFKDGVVEILEAHKLEAVKPQENTQSGVSENQDQKISDALANASAVFKENNYSQAIDVFTAVLKLNPSPEIAIKIHNNLGICYGKLGKFEEARNAYTEALKLNPKMTEARNNLRWLFLENGKVNDAIKEFQDGHSIDPKNLRIWTNLAWAYYLEGEFEAAIATNRDILKDYPEALVARYNLGLAYLCNKQLNDAEREYVQALESGRDEPAYKSAIDDLKSLIVKGDENKENAEKMLEILEEYGTEPLFEGDTLEQLKTAFQDEDTFKIVDTQESKIVDTQESNVLKIVLNDINEKSKAKQRMKPEELTELKLPDLLNQYKVEVFVDGPSFSNGRSDNGTLIFRYVAGDLARFTLDIDLQGDKLKEALKPVGGVSYALRDVCDMLNAHMKGVYTINAGTRYFCEEFFARRGLIQKNNDGQWESTGKKNHFILSSNDNISFFTHEVRHAELLELDKLDEAQKAYFLIDPSVQYAFIASVLEERNYGADIETISFQFSEEDKRQDISFDEYMKLCEQIKKSSGVLAFPKVFDIKFKTDKYEETRSNKMNYNKFSFFSELYAYSNDMANEDFSDTPYKDAVKANEK